MLLDFAIRSTILLLIAGAAAYALRGRSAAWRHLIWLAGLLALLVLPLARVAIPQWNPPVAAQRMLEAVPIMRTVIYVTAPDGRAPAVDWALAVWLCGVAFFVVRAVRAQVLAAGLARRSTPGVDGVLVSDETQVPLVCGLWRPVVVLPVGAEAWPAERLESVLRHERMHIARRDTIAQALAQLACAMYWPQPLVWIAAAAMRKACEQACDDGVLSQGTRASEYAGHLMEVARGLASRTNSAAAFEGGIAMTRTNQLEERIAALLHSKRDRRAAGASFATAVSAVAMTIVLGLSAVPAPLFAQQNGKLSGVVRDFSGAVIPKARVDVQQRPVENGKVMHEIAYTNAIGEWSLDVSAGTYDITIAAPGFATQHHDQVKFESGVVGRLEVMMAIGGIRETVNVKGENDLAMKMKLEAEQRAFKTMLDTGAAPMANGRPQRIRVGGNVQAANLIRKVTPVYPQTAKLDGVEGTVIMTAVISKDGNILSLEQVNKLVDSRLAEAAMEAVKQWQYKPTLLNGEPIEVVTQIDVNFTLSR